MVWQSVISPESGAGIPMFPNPNLPALHPSAVGAELNQMLTAKLINRTPAAGAS